jgi:hypothetical protein
MTGIVVLVGVSPGHCQDAPATLVVTVPEDARIPIDGKATRQTGTPRTFASPPRSKQISLDVTLAKLEILTAAPAGPARP